MANQDGFSPSYWSKERVVVPAGGSILSAPIPIITMRAAKYIMAAWNDSVGKTKYQEIQIKNENGVLTSSVGAKIPSNFNLTIAEEINAGNMNLRISTTESFDVSVDIAYLIFS